MTHGSLFSGIGGFDLAARNCGIDNIFQVEIDEHCRKILEKNFPNTKKYTDIKEFNGKQYYDRIDIISGGFPCQDFSIAGINNDRKGFDGNRSSLFFEMIRIISEIRPKYVIWENSPQVYKSINVIIEEFRKLGYVNWQGKIRADKFGFPHKRERLYGVAIANTDSVGRNAYKNFCKVIKEKLQSTKIQRLSTSNKAKFSRTFSSSLRDEADSQFLRMDNGLSDKLDADRIRALGNAIVPQIAEQIFKTIIEVDYLSTN